MGSLQTSAVMNRILGLILLAIHVSSQPQNRLAGILDFLGNIPRSLPSHPFIPVPRSDQNIEEEEKDLKTEAEEIAPQQPPNFIRAGLNVVDGTVQGGSRIVGGVLNIFGNIPKLLPRPSITIERVEKEEGIEERSGRVQEDEIRLTNSVSDVKESTKYCDHTATTNNLQEVLKNISEFSTFAELVVFADVTEEIYREYGVTVLAPSDVAFNKLDKQIVKELFDDKAVAQQEYQEIMEYYSTIVVRGRLLNLSSHSEEQPVVICMQINQR